MFKCINDINPIEIDDILKELPPLEEMSDEQLFRLCEVKRDIDELKRRYPIKYYKPQKHQEYFHRSQKKVRLITGGNQSGKTTAAIAESLWLALGIHPYRKIRVPNKGRIIGTDLQKGIGEVIQEKMNELIPYEEVMHPIKKYSTGEYKKINFKNRSTIEFLSYEQDTKLFEGWTGDWAYFDEPPPRDKYIATIRGLMRMKGIVFLAMTPLSEAWIYDEIYMRAGSGADSPDVFHFDIRDNEYLSEEEILEFEKNLTADEKDARIHGKFRHLSGLIYKEFSPDIHIVDDFDIPSNWERIFALDYHPRVPCAGLWVAFDEKGVAYVYDELYADKTVKELAELIKAKEGKDNIRTRVIDSISATPDRITGVCPQREFARYGLAFRSSTKTWVLGKNTVQQYLKLGKDGKPFIYFFRNSVPNMIHSISRYSWDEYSYSNKENIKEVPSKQYSHFPDCLRYILILKPILDDKVNNFRHIKKSIYPVNSITGYNFGGIL